MLNCERIWEEVNNKMPTPDYSRDNIAYLNLALCYFFIYYMSVIYLMLLFLIFKKAEFTHCPDKSYSLIWFSFLVLLLIKAETNNPFKLSCIVNGLELLVLEKKIIYIYIHPFCLTVDFSA